MVQILYAHTFLLSLSLSFTVRTLSDWKHPHKWTQAGWYSFTFFFWFNRFLLARVSASSDAKYIKKNAMDLSYHLSLSVCPSVYLSPPRARLHCHAGCTFAKLFSLFLSFSPSHTRANTRSCQTGWVRCVQAICPNSGINQWDRERERQKKGERLKRWVLRDWTHSYWGRTFCPQAQHKTMHDGRKWPSVSRHNSAGGESTITHTHPADVFLQVCMCVIEQGWADGRVE